MEPTTNLAYIFEFETLRQSPKQNRWRLCTTFCLRNGVPFVKVVDSLQGDKIDWNDIHVQFCNIRKRVMSWVPLPWIWSNGTKSFEWETALLCCHLSLYSHEKEGKKGASSANSHSKDFVPFDQIHGINRTFNSDVYQNILFKIPLLPESFRRGYFIIETRRQVKKWKRGGGGPRPSFTICRTCRGKTPRCCWTCSRLVPTWRDGCTDGLPRYGRVWWLELPKKSLTFGLLKSWKKPTAIGGGDQIHGRLGPIFGLTACHWPLEWCTKSIDRLLL